MDISQILLTSAVLLAGSILQGAVGFAFAILTVPLLVQVGLTLGEAVVLIALPVTLQLILATYRLRQFVLWRQVALASVIRLLTLPFGMMLLVVFDSLNRTQMQQILGILVLIAVGLQYLGQRQVSLPPHPIWRFVAFASSGIMQGAASMGGPPAILWVMAQAWTNQQVRAFMQALFLLVSPVHIALLLLTLGTEMISVLLTGLLFVPVIFLGTYLGMALGSIMSREVLRTLAFGILLLSALSSILGPVLS